MGAIWAPQWKREGDRIFGEPTGTATAVFTHEELWLLQSVIRHETSQQEQWRHPPASLELNDQIVEAILRSEEIALTEAALILNWKDCLVIDYCVPQAAKSPSGAPIGKSILLKSYRARRAIVEGESPSAAEPKSPSKAQIVLRLKEQNGGQ